MQSIKSYIFAIVAGAVIVSPFTNLGISNVIPDLALKEVKAATDAPSSFGVQVRDHNCSDQEVAPARAYQSTSEFNGASVTDSNAKDPDCGRIFLQPGDVSSTPQSQSIYSQDFRIGTRLAESESGCNAQAGSVRWTPWVSEGGGASPYATAGSSVNDPDCLGIYYQTRPLPAGILIKDVRVGISTGYAAFQYTPWARSIGGGDGVSTGYRWGSGGGNISGAAVALDVQFVEIFDAEYVSDTIPDTMTRGQSGTYNITMKNKATQWASDDLPTDHCMTDMPVSRGDTCSVDVVASSNSYKLRYLGNDPGFSVTANPFKYQRAIHRDYTAIDYCIRGSSLLDSVIKTAHALPREPGNDDPGGGGGWTCIEWGLQYVLSAQTPNNNIGVNDSGTFSLALSASGSATNGVHTLEFQMDKAGDDVFGSKAYVNISIGNPLNCTANQTVTAGGIAHYSVWLTSGQTGSYNITMGSTPSAPVNPTMTNSPLVLNAGNTYAGIADVSTANVPGGTYNLTFNSATPALSCPATLQVIDREPPVVDIQFNESNGPITLPSGTSTGQIRWSTLNADSCIAATQKLDGTPLTTSWSGSRTPANTSWLTEPSSILSGPQTYVFKLTCSNTTDTRSDTVEVTIGAPPVPTVELSCIRPSDSLPDNTECQIPYGTSGLLTWTSTSSESCSIDPALSGPINTNQASPVATGQLISDRLYTLTCVSPSGVSVSDTVNFVIVTNPTFTMSCNPLTAQVTPGDITSYDIDLVSVDGFADVVNVRSDGVGGKNAPTIDFTNNDIVPSGTVTGVVTTSGNTTPGTYTIQFIASSNGPGAPASELSCDVELIVNESPAPNPPINVRAFNNGQCGTIDLTWNRGRGGVNPTSFQVYRTGEKGDYESVGSEIIAGPFDDSRTVYSFTDTSPVSPYSSNYYAVAAFYNGSASAYTTAVPSPIVPIACAPNVSTSDKDVVSVQGRINKTFTPLDCSGTSETATLPNNALFAPGDIVTFRINVCNTGTQAMTKVIVADTHTNLSGLEVVNYSPKNCVTGTEGTDDNFIINMEDIDPNSACSVNIRATVTAPSNPSAAIYRFQNRAAIEADGISIIVRTPPYLFSISGGVPDRTETGPQ